MHFRDEQYVMEEMESELRRLDGLLQSSGGPVNRTAAEVLWAGEASAARRFALGGPFPTATACGERCQAAATGRVRLSRRAEQQPCKERLVHVAVPVISHERHIATVWQPAPAPAGAIAPVRRFLELLAEHLAAAWGRLSRLAEQEARTCMQELADILLDGDVRQEARLRELTCRMGLGRLPNRALVLVPAPPERQDWRGDLEQLRAAIPGRCVASLQRSEICIMLDERPDGTAADESILDDLEKAGLCGFRAGRGTAKAIWTELPDSYHEARLALAGSKERVVLYNANSAGESLAALSTQARRFVMRRDLAGARRILMSAPLLANREIGRTAPEHYAAQRGHLSFLLAILADAAQQTAGSAFTSGNPKPRTLPPNGGLLGLQQAFVREGERILAELSRCFGDRHGNMVARARREVECRLASPAEAGGVSIGAVASHLGVSVSHLSRVFHRHAGQTFQDFLARRRVELARTLLLDPTSSVTEVAERCGIPDTTYFSRVFRRLTGQSPREYRNGPVARPDAC